MTARRSLVLHPVNGQATRLAAPRRPSRTPVQQWSYNLQRALPGLSEPICLKASRRIMRYGPTIIFRKKRAMGRNNRGLGVVEYAGEMRRVLRAAQSCSGIASSASCYKFFEGLRCAYTAMYGRPRTVPRTGDVAAGPVVAKGPMSVR